MNYIVAVDFDGTIVEKAFPLIGKTKEHVFGVLNYLRDELKCVLILNTCRSGRYLKEAIEFISSNGFEFDYVNENTKEMIDIYGDCRKIFANIYIDDHNLFFTKNNGDTICWIEIREEIKSLVKSF